MKLFILGFATAILIIPILACLYRIAVFMWGDWRTGEIVSALRKDRQRRKYLKAKEKTS